MQRKHIYAIVITIILVVSSIMVGLKLLSDQFDTDIHEKDKASGGHDKHEEVQFLQLSDSELEEFGIVLGRAAPGKLQIHRDFPGEIAIDPDRLAHIAPRFPGIVKQVRKSLGDMVEKGEVLAIIESNESLTEYEVRSLINGKVIEMHLTQGENISEADHAFTIADLTEVWVNLNVYQKDLRKIMIGQNVEIDDGTMTFAYNGKISYISPILDEHTRTATARVVLTNKDGYLRPGLFISSRVVVEEITVPFLVPKTAIQDIDGKPSIFVKSVEGFQASPVRLGKENELTVEVLSGLVHGEEYVMKGGFTLKAQLAKSSFGDEH